MIKLKNLEKFYNKNKTNEIHVIDNINLELPDSGLVVLLGPSGSGKTTLLNVLGGLDKVQSGVIEFGDEVLNRYSSARWDKIRNRKVGYIFQNYNLLTNMTVYDNISLTLNMIGIYDKQEIDKRIDYILDSMGMINYRKRRAAQLSGGQQQRVAIARALAKNPQVIIADEPTGNLDSKNTHDIMSIIKRISLNKLVVLVTHEEELADFYGDRIIRLKDGQIISDDENKSTNSLDVKHEADIYLQDLNIKSELLDDIARVKLYSDEDIDDKLDIRLIVKNKTLYLDVKSIEYKKIQLLDKDSEINILDKKYEKIERQHIDDSLFELDAIASDEAMTDRHSVVSFKDSLMMAIRRIGSPSFVKFLIFLAFAGSAILIGVGVHSIAGIFEVDSEDFLDYPMEYVGFARDEYTFDELIAFEENEYINYIGFVHSGSFRAELPTIFQVSYYNDEISGVFVPSDYLDDKDIKLGRNVNAVNEVVINESVALRILDNYAFGNLGITTLGDLLELEYYYQYPAATGMVKYAIKVVGISDDESPVFYASEELIYWLSTGLPVYEMFSDDITMVRGVLPTEFDEVMFYDSPFITDPLSGNDVAHGGLDLTIAGTYTSTEDVPARLFKLDAIKEIIFTNNYKLASQRMFAHTSDREKAIEYLISQEAKSTVDVYSVERADFIANRLLGRSVQLTFSILALGASAISFFFIIRSSLLSRIYEISVYRALGISKSDVVKMFVTEVVLLTTITSIVGYLITTYIIFRIQIASQDYFDFVRVSIWSFTSGIVLIYTINIISGIFPISNLLRKTPAEILSKYDF